MEVIVNGSPSQIRSEGLVRMSELVELVKSWIDPEHMITRIVIDGREFEENDWTANLSQFGTSILEVETGTPESFVNSRFGQAANIVNACYIVFRDSRKSFQDGNMQQGNQRLVKAVNLLQAFFEWYSSIINLVEPSKRNNYNIDEYTRDISAICKRICQQQLYQSWWALGEAIQKELEPKLDQLEDFCRKFAVAN